VLVFLGKIIIQVKSKVLIKTFDNYLYQRITNKKKNCVSTESDFLLKQEKKRTIKNIYRFRSIQKPIRKSKDHSKTRELLT
jgi:hypothetical protein